MGKGRKGEEKQRGREEGGRKKTRRGARGQGGRGDASRHPCFSAPLHLTLPTLLLKDAFTHFSLSPLLLCSLALHPPNR